MIVAKKKYSALTIAKLKKKERGRTLSAPL
jgi:hypothetical protein